MTEASDADRLRMPLLVTAPDGFEYEIRLDRSPRLGLWINGPWRWWNTVRNDQSWWLTVTSSVSQLPLIRESLPSQTQASVRAEALIKAIRSGDWHPPSKPAIRRRRVASTEDP